jgi:putative hemolysin
MIWEILFILFLIFLNALFAAAETALIAARKGRLEQRADEGNKNARRALELARNPDLFLPTAQIGISVVSALGAAYGGDQVVEHIKAWLVESSSPFVARHAEGLGLGIFVVCFTYVSLILGELVPKRASLHRAEGLAILLAPLVQFLGIVARPVVWFMGMSTSVVLWALRLGAESEPTV